MYTITADQLHRAAPHCENPVAWVDPINSAALLYGVAYDRESMVEWLAQCAHESLSFNRLEENLNYTAERLVQVWPTRFPSITVAAAYARNPHKLADFVYSNRMGNGSVESGDGWNYRGRAILMVTGLANYRAVSKRLGDPSIVTCPARLCTRSIAAMAAAAWWFDHPHLRELADAGDTVSITRVVNGGTVGLAERVKFRDAFSAAMAPT